jgi:hypothetical protein
MMKKDWEIRASTIYGLSLLAGIIGVAMGPLLPGWLMPFVGLFFFIRLKSQGRIKKFDFLEVVLILVYTLIILVTSLAYGIITYVGIPWYLIILMGMFADLIASIGGSLPGPGDFVSAIIVFIMAITLVGGIYGAVIALSIAIITLLPGPTLGANTLFLIIFKVASELVAWGVLR